jgi:endonuclease-3
MAFHHKDLPKEKKLRHADGKSMVEPAEIREVDRRLRKLYGDPQKPPKDAVSQLVATMLSQATTDIQTARSFQNLRRQFRTWEAVRDAPVSQVAKAIRSSGLSKQKAPRIKRALQHITSERGRIELNFLKKLPAEEARRWLMNIAGVGPKTASIVLLFTYQQPLFPVDTHIHRVTKRLGWIPQEANAEKAHEILTALVPPELHYRLHLNLINLGREICQARRPRCQVCPLTDLCEYYAKVYSKK